MAGSGDKTFVNVRITNQDIYNEIRKLSVHVKETNGKVKLNTWRSMTSLTLTVAMFTAMAGFLVKTYI